MEKIQITTPGIKKALKRYKTHHAVAESIWNGFDAKATKVEIEIDYNDIGFIEEMRIIDNGYGIPYNELTTKFTPFFESEKEIDPELQKSSSVMHGKNGVGRLTFFTFANTAEWNTRFSLDGQTKEYSIKISSSELETYIPSSRTNTDKAPGTKLTFKGFRELTSDGFFTEVVDYLCKEFGWFLELNKEFELIINGEHLNYQGLVGDEDTFDTNIENEEFSIRYIRWNEFIPEYSRYYFVNSKEQEVFKKTTTLNNKGDHFFHSVYITSSFFNNFDGPLFSSDEKEDQRQLFEDDRNHTIYEELLIRVDEFLKDKRRPHLEQYTDKLIKNLEEEEAFPKSSGNGWEDYRRSDLEGLIRELFQVEPRIFVNLNKEQKRTFVHLLDLVIDSGERDRLLDILDAIVTLDKDEREKLAELLRTTSLSRVLQTIKLIEDRYKAVESLKVLVFNKGLKVSEPQHIQKLIEKHYWIFGEQFHLVTAAEPKFEEALRRYLYILRGETEPTPMEHPDKNKEMDIFLVRQDVSNDLIENIVVELKNPRIKLGEKELSQLKKYFRVISKEDRFNGINMHWTFILVGNSFDNSGYIDGEIISASNHGEKALVYKSEMHKIFVRKWSEIFNTFEIRHKFLNDKLQLQRQNLIEIRTDADEIVAAQIHNSAMMPGEIQPT